MLLFKRQHQRNILRRGCRDRDVGQADALIDTRWRDVAAQVENEVGAPLRLRPAARLEERPGLGQVYWHAGPKVAESSPAQLHLCHTSLPQYSEGTLQQRTPDSLAPMGRVYYYQHKFAMWRRLTRDMPRLASNKANDVLSNPRDEVIARLVRIVGDGDAMKRRSGKWPQLTWRTLPQVVHLLFITLRIVQSDCKCVHIPASFSSSRLSLAS